MDEDVQPVAAAVTADETAADAEPVATEVQPADDVAAPGRAQAQLREILADAIGSVPRGLLVAAVWALCLLLLGLLVWGLALLAGRLSSVVLPVFAAFLLTAALKPLNDFLVARRVPRWLAALISLLVLVIVVQGLLTLVAVEIGSQWSDLSRQMVDGSRQLALWLNHGPLHISQDQLDSYLGGLTKFLSDQQSAIAAAAADVGKSIARFLTGVIMCLFAIFFFLKDGHRFAQSMHRMVPAGMRAVVLPAASSGWSAMVNYVRAAVIVAACDGAGAGLGALILGSQLWSAIMALTFVCAFVPMLGALIAGGVGCIIVLATLGWVKALIMLAVFVVVLETEVHVMQPLLLGRATDIHPLVVLICIAIGMVLAGIAGGVFAIPLAALFWGVIRAAAGQNDQDDVPARPVFRKPSFKPSFRLGKAGR